MTDVIGSTSTEGKTTDDTEATLTLGGDVVEEGEGFVFVENLLPPELVAKIEAEALSVQSSIHTSWQSDRSRDKEGIKGTFQTFRLMTGGGGFGLRSRAEMAERCPITSQVIGALETKYGGKLSSAQFNYYPPHTYFPPHQDSSQEPAIALAVGVSGEGRFRVLSSTNAGLEEVSSRKIQPGDSAILTSDFDGAYNVTPYHEAVNDTDVPRISLAVFINPEQMPSR